MCTHYRSSQLGRLYLYRRQVPTSRNWGSVQFLTRSHRTALSEQTGSVPRVTTTPLYILDTRSRLITSGGTPGGRCDDDSFVCYGEFCQTPMVPPAGIEPTVSAVKGQRVDLFHYGGIFLFSFALILIIVVFRRIATYLISATCAA